MSVEEPSAEELAELARLGGALTGDSHQAAELIGLTLALASRGTRRKPGEPEAAMRNLMVQRFVSARPAAGPPATEELPEELGDVAARLSALRPLARAIVVLVRLRDLTLAEVAGILDRTPAAVQRELAAAIGRLRAEPSVVRATLEALSWRVPNEDAIRRARVSAERHLTRQRRRVRLLVAAVVVLVLGGMTVPTVWTLRPLPARTAGEWSYGLSLTPPEGWEVVSHYLTVDEEGLELSQGDAARCQVEAWLPTASGENRPGPGGDSERIWVRGRPVRYTQLPGETRVHWPYADTGEVTLTCRGEAAIRTTTLDIAERLRFRPGQRLSVPVAFGPVPEGLRPAYAGTQQDQTFLGLITGPGLDRTEIFVFAGLFRDEFAGPEWAVREVVLVNGTAAQLYVNDALVALCLPAASGPESVCVGSDVDDEDVDSDQDETQARIAANTRRVQAVAEGMRIAPDLSDRSTWFDAREALRQ